MDAPGDAAPPAKDSFAVSGPAVTLPKGGGAIRGIGEKFAANPVTGTGSMSVLIATSLPPRVWPATHPFLKFQCWLFYDPAEHVVVALHPNHTWKKVVSHPWHYIRTEIRQQIFLRSQE